MRMEMRLSLFCRITPIVLTAATLKTPSTPVIPRQLTRFCVSRKGTTWEEKRRSNALLKARRGLLLVKYLSKVDPFWSFPDARLTSDSALRS